MQGSFHEQTRIGPMRNYFGPIRKKLADTHFFIPDTHNAVMMVYGSELSYTMQLACQGKI